MSLTGNLEDLPLLDILQIVSFSKKTGYLGITTSAGEGAIVFSDGFVVSSFAWDMPPLDPRIASLGAAQREAMIRRRIEMALEHLIRLRDGQFQFSLTDKTPTSVGPRDISVETLAQGINPQELLLDLARGMDEDRRDSSAAIEASFEEPAVEGAAAPPEEAAPPAPEATPARAEAEAPIPESAATSETRDTGPEYTALRYGAPELTMPLQALPPELMAQLAASATRAAAPEEAAASAGETPAPELETPAEAPPAETPKAKAVGDDTVPPGLGARPEESGPAAPEAAAMLATPVSDEIQALLLVDDEEDVRRILAQRFTEGGYQVVEAEDPDSAVKKAQRLSRAGIGFVLVTDLGMPTSGGSSFQGGFEVVKRLVKMKLDPPVLMMTDTLSAAVRSRAKQMGIQSFVFKPSLSKLDPEQHLLDLRGFADKLIASVLPKLARHKSAAVPKPMKAEAAAAPKAAPADPSRDMKFLQQHLAELRGVADASRISTLIMRVAREFFERGILFLIKNDEVRGLGGFGPAGKGENINLVVREMAIPLSEPSVFLDLVSSSKPWNGVWPDAKWSQHLIGRIGRFRSTHVALLPLVAHRETIALLYGDNPETGREIGNLEAIELFMHQAGIAMENTLLQRKLRSMQEKG